MERDITDRDHALFEAGIKLGALYHQFVGTPLNLETLEGLEKTIEKSISVQPYLEKIRITINRDMVREKLGRFGYCGLEGKMLEVHAEIVFGSAKAKVGLRYDEELDYPLMYIEEISQRR